MLIVQCPVHRVSFVISLVSPSLLTALKPVRLKKTERQSSASAGLVGIHWWHLYMGSRDANHNFGYKFACDKIFSAVIVSFQPSRSCVQNLCCWDENKESTKNKYLTKLFSSSLNDWPQFCLWKFILFEKIRICSPILIRRTVLRMLNRLRGLFFLECAELATEIYHYHERRNEETSSAETCSSYPNN